MIHAEVIGDPIAHSKSPLIHGFWLKALGIDAEYRAVRVAPEALGAYVAERAPDPDWRGCNVTIPHKVAILDHVADPGGVRESIGAANTVARGGDGPFATNTDAAGFYAPLAEQDLAGAPVAVIGAGGAARAVLFALAKMGVGPVTLLNRTPLKGAALLARFGLKGKALPLGATLPPVRLLVNASPLGMAGQPELALDLDPLPEDAIVYDLVYAPLDTPLLLAAEARGLEAIDGLDMLIGQAALAFELFFGAAPPRDRDEELRALLGG
ncbi:MAG: shikimate dehydrogenase [Proteobacteria bacterium SG_bin6]|nr:MAG: shikimate dehydrogenase [Proteobacteria bacterium SG_bin6]